MLHLDHSQHSAIMCSISFADLRWSDLFRARNDDHATFWRHSGSLPAIGSWYQKMHCASSQSPEAESGLPR